jgi:hypothetical protein
MRRETDRLHRHAFLHATITRECDYVMIENRVLCRIEASRRHLPGECETNCVADTLA